MQLVRSGDVDLACDCFGDGPPLLFAHGLAATRGISRQQLAPLADRYRVIVFDQRGHGQSTPMTDPAGYDPAAMARDIAAVMDAVGVERAIVGGESMGAATALLFALAQPERVERLLLTAPAFDDTPNPQAAHLKTLGSNLAEQGIDEFLHQAAQRQRTLFGWTETAIGVVAATFRAHRQDSLATALRTVPDWRPFLEST